MNLTTEHLKRIIKEEIEACQREYSVCVKGVEDPSSSEAIECMDEMRDCEKEQSHTGTLAKMKAQAQRPAGMGPEDVKGGFKAYRNRWWSQPEQRKARQKVQDKYRWEEADWHFNRKTKMYRFAAGTYKGKPDYREYPGYKRTMASVWPAYEKCHDAAKKSYQQQGWGELSYAQASQYYEMEKGGCEQHKLAPIERWLEGLEKQALEKHEQENMDPEVYKYFQKHTARKDKIAGLRAKRAQLQKDIKGWDDAQASIDYMHEARKTIKVRIK